MLRTPGFRCLVILSIVLSAPAILSGGANVWTGSRAAGGADLLDPALVVSLAANPDLVYSAQGPNLFRSADGGLTWGLVASFDQIYSLYLDPASGALLLGALRPGSLAGIYKSSDGGATWRETLNLSFHVFVRFFAGSSGSSSTLYASSYNVIYRSSDGGETWEQANFPKGEDIHLAQQIAALVIDPDDGQPFAGGYDYDYGYYSYSPVGPFLRKSEDQGDNWTDLSDGLTGIDVSAIAFDPVNPSTVYAGSGTTPYHVAPTDSLWRSADGGASWVLAQSGLPSHASISALVVDPRDPSRVYAATDSGVYRTRDSGASWFPLGQLLFGTTVGSLTLDSPVLSAGGRVLRVGGISGVYELEIGAGALDVAAGAGRSRVLSWDADSLTIRTLDDSGHESSTPPEGPSDSWLAAALSDGADGLSRVLWLGGDGRAALELVGPSGSQAVFHFAAVANWSPADVSVRSDGTANLLWRSQSGAMYLSSVDASGSVTPGPPYGPYSSWTPLALADSPDGSTWVLWRAADGRTSVSVHHDRVMGEVFRFPPSPDLAPVDITVASDGRPRLLRVGVDGTAEVSTINALGNLTDAQRVSPGLRPRRIAAGSDGLTRLLFSDGSGAARIWLLNPDNTVQAAPQNQNETRTAARKDRGSERPVTAP